MATIEQMEKEIGQWEAALAGVHETREAARGHIAGLERKRQELALTARVHKDSAAQKTLHEIEVETEKARREDGHDEAAVAEIEKKLQVLRPSLALAKRLAEAEQLRQFIAKRAAENRPVRIFKLVRELEAQLDGWNADRAEVAAALRQFDPRCDRVASALTVGYRDPAQVRYGTNRDLTSFACVGESTYEAALAMIEEVLESGGSPATQSEGQVAEASVARDPQPEGKAKFDVFV
ncbi:MAG: hypothetical protein WCC59_18880 [Terriglobales bacterium]